jgi:arabinan endo-1,5-alpha-L-arabinosidase
MSKLLASVLSAASACALASIASAVDGQIGIHDPSTVVLCSGKFYTYGTGGSSLVSDDGWPWRRGTALPRRGLAPDFIHLGGRYYAARSE